jgi:hypothetical protein
MAFSLRRLDATATVVNPTAIRRTQTKVVKAFNKVTNQLGFAASRNVTQSGST